MRNRRAILIVIAVIMATLLVASSASVALARSRGPNKRPHRYAQQFEPQIINAARAFGKAKLFWAAAQYFVAQGYQIETADLQDDLDAALYHLNRAFELAETDPATAIAEAQMSKDLSEFVKNTLEQRIHAVGRSVGEYKKSDCQGVLVFGGDVNVCAATAAHLESHGISAEVLLNQPLQSVNFCKFKAIIFDPEYAYFRGTYGGLSPQDNRYLEKAISCGKIGLVYMEPYPWDPYTRYGQLLFLPVNFNGQWVLDGTWSVADSSHPIATDLPSSFTVASYGQWDGLGLQPNPKVSQIQVVVKDVGPTVIAFSYGRGKVVILGADTYWAEFDDPTWGILLRNATLWVAR